MSTFTMQVVGNFAARVDLKQTHCGPNPKEFLNFRYEVKIIAKRLDADGFVIDNADVKNYMENIKLITVSCELLTQQVCRELWRPNFESIRVKLWGTDWANVECYRRRKDVLV